MPVHGFVPGLSGDYPGTTEGSKTGGNPYSARITGSPESQTNGTPQRTTGRVCPVSGNYRYLCDITNAP